MVDVLDLPLLTAPEITDDDAFYGIQNPLGVATDRQGTIGALATAAPFTSRFAPITSPTFTGIATAPRWAASGVTGATSATRYVGGTTSGVPASGTHSVGDWIVARDGRIYVCTVAGTPGTWVDVAAAALLTIPEALAGVGIDLDTSVPGFVTINALQPILYVYSANDTFIYPTGTKMVVATCIGSGGGGGAGERGAAGAVRQGGGGGEAGYASTEVIDVSALNPAGEAVVVGAAVAGGVGTAVNGSTGTNGGNGNTSSLGTLLSAGGGLGGFAGGFLGQGIGGGDTGNRSSRRGSHRINPGGSANLTSAATPTASYGGHVGSGGAGGGIDTANTPRAGGNAGGGAGAAAATGGAAGANGNAGNAAPADSSGGGSGGGGGGAESGGTCGTGGAGGAPGGGGGGGGASINAGATSGSGGASGAGRVIVLAIR